MKTYPLCLVAELDRFEDRRSKFSKAQIQVIPFEDKTKLFLNVIVRHDDIIVEDKIFEIMEIPK